MTAEPSPAAGALAGTVLDRYPEEAARLLDDLPPQEAWALIRERLVPQAAAVLQSLLPEMARRILVLAGPDQGAAMLVALDPPRAASLLAGMTPASRDPFLQAMPSRDARELKRLASYPPETAGALMDPRVVAVRRDQTVAQVIDQMRTFKPNVRRIFVVDADGVLAGSVPLKDLVVADPADPVALVARSESVSVHETAGREEIIELMHAGKLASVAVVDGTGRLLGVIRNQELVRAAEDVASRSLQAMVGASPDERALSPASFAIRKRLPWLEVNLLTAFLAASVVALFESTIARHTALAVLLPVVAGQSGNTGAQALAVTMRGVALREVHLRQWPAIFWKEARVGLVNGIAVALTTAAGVYLWSRSPGLALVIGVSMVLSMVIAGLSGAAVPLALTALGQDPAQSSSILLTTVTDVAGFFSFLGIATLLSSLL